MELSNNQVDNFNFFLTSGNIHVGKPHSRFTPILIANSTHVKFDFLLESGLIEPTGRDYENSRGQKEYTWTEKGRKLLQLKDWFAFVAWEKTIPEIIENINQEEYYKALDIRIKEQQARMNDMELKIKPVNYGMAKAAFIVSGISLLQSLGLLRWLLKHILTLLGISL